MNWRHKAQEVITGKKSHVVYITDNNDLQKVINKCRYKYSQGKDYKKLSMNTTNVTRLYTVRSNVYKVVTTLHHKACGWTYCEKDGTQATKYYYKQHIYNDYDKIPEDLINSIDARRSKDDGSKYIVWEYISDTRFKYLEGGK